jgi:hypothetical protein
MHSTANSFTSSSGILTIYQLAGMRALGRRMRLEFGSTKPATWIAISSMIVKEKALRVTLYSSFKDITYLALSIADLLYVLRYKAEADVPYSKR